MAYWPAETTAGRKCGSVPLDGTKIDTIVYWLRSAGASTTTLENINTSSGSLVRGAEYKNTYGVRPAVTVTLP